MAVPSLEKVYTTAHGISNDVLCPACAETVSLSLFENMDLSAINTILGKEVTTYFAVCPKCASVLSINPNYMKEKLNGTTCTLTKSDLEIMVKNNG
ncbi:MAG: hypothetical protein NC122_06635 [Faecalibacterium sp.]|nr:hypothetical protein [Ruminococcus sp.]MCM1391504.1 hypothetical protein [Ruminococcus sp.]MCM1485868.1 hypothetical protein [Faecalibacterium sp.]